MVEKKDISIGGVAILALLLSVGGFIPQEDSTHICIEDGTISKEGVFVRLSSTGITGYPNIDNNKGRKRCKTKWIEINRDIEETITHQQSKVKNEICYPEPIGCK